MLMSFSSHLLAQESDKLLNILRSELNEQYKELQTKEMPPYLMSYRVVDQKKWVVGSSFGNLETENYSQSRTLMPQIRIGDMELDNMKDNFSGGQGLASLPIDASVLGEEAIRQAIWDESKNRYEAALSAYQYVKSKEATQVEKSDKAPAYGVAEVEQYYEPQLTMGADYVNLSAWATRLNELTEVFKYNGHVISANAYFTFLVERRYFIDTDGREIVQNLPYCRVMVMASIKAEDGMVLPLNLSYFTYDPADLPTQEKLMADTKELYAKLVELRTAPVVDPFTGPAILSGEASGVFFHEIFGHRIEGRRLKSETDGQTFKKMVGEFVLPETMHVYDDPTIKKYAGQDLNGYYKFDDEGVRGERVHVVKKGKLNDFLMTRTPIDNFPKSNGHARGMGPLDPVSRQSNLIIETDDHKTDKELRALLIKEIKKQEKDFGFFFKEVTGGLTFTGKGGINSFDVDPLEVYKVYADGRPDELVRGVKLIGTPLSMFSNIIHAGGQAEVFTGMCGAESGSIPVTAISPYLLVNKVEVQRVDKSQDLPRILPTPVVK